MAIYGFLQSSSLCGRNSEYFTINLADQNLVQTGKLLRRLRSISEGITPGWESQMGEILL